MGVTFRSGDYIRFVRFGGRTIKDGEAAAIWNRDGVHSQVVGPKRVWLTYSTIRFLSRYKAEAHQFIVVKHRDGQVEHLHGPISTYLNPALHDSMRVYDGINLHSEDDRVVVLKKGESPKVSSKKSDEIPQGTTRYILKGPAMFFPEEDEIVQDFHWSVPPSHLDESQTLTARKFQTLTRGVPECWKVQGMIQTNDGVEASMNLSINYEIDDVMKCVASRDPVARMVASLRYDLHRFGLRVSHETLLGSDLESPKFASLRQAALGCGLKLNEVLVVSVDPSQDFKRQQFEREKQDRQNQQELASYLHEQRVLQEKSAVKQLGIDLDADLQRKEARVRAEVSRDVAKYKMDLLEQELMVEDFKMQSQEKRKRLKNQIDLDFYKGLADLGIDVTRVMCSRYHVPAIGGSNTI